ncbi:Deoxyribonuclease Tat-D [Fusarium culmorum]|uniref:Deoxyribonuclease Tat-D n=1 Tax=Fusarium culmorum TaxID=5516 RepID=A0A2T4GMM5_FUSCU|nr:Deoxyribonuclease Tat-D [Fusarium culmorum]
MSSTVDLSAFPTAAPAAPSAEIRYADVAVTATAKEFKGVYRDDKQCHEPDFINTLDRAKDAGVSKVMLTGMSLSDASHNDSITKQRPAQAYYTIGVHPYHASELEQGGKAYLAELEQKVKNALAQDSPHIAAFGELGLDYDKEEHASKDVQKKAFVAQLDLFVKNQWDLPLFLHCRNAFDDFVETMTPYMEKLPRGGLVHSFVGSASQMEKLVSMGFGVSVNGFSFQTTESLEMVSKIPLDALQLETDAPWGELKSTSEVVKQYCANARPLPASKKRDKWDAKCMVKERNESCTMERVALVVAGLKGVAVDEVAEAAWRNSAEGMPKGCAWGVFDQDGKKDMVGTLNFLTPEVVRNAALEVKDGISISLNWPLNAMTKLNVPGRAVPEHTVLYIPESLAGLPFEQGKSWDDEVSFNTQCSSQWDSLCHFQHQDSGLAYNGANPDKKSLSVDSTESNTMPTLDHWHSRGCIAGRGVLIDYAAYAGEKKIEFHPFDGNRITVEDLEACAAYQKVEFQPGDILLVRTGATEVVDRMDPVGLGKMMAMKLSGLDGSEEMARWMWNKRFAAAASDSSAFEAFPPLKPDGSIGGMKDLGTLY